MRITGIEKYKQQYLLMECLYFIQDEWHSFVFGEIYTRINFRAERERMELERQLVWDSLRLTSNLLIPSWGSSASTRFISNNEFEISSGSTINNTKDNRTEFSKTRDELNSSDNHLTNQFLVTNKYLDKRRIFLELHSACFNYEFITNII